MADNPPKPESCSFCHKAPPTKLYKFTSIKTSTEVAIWVCDACYAKTQN